MKRFLKYILFSSFLFLFLTQVKANNINSINMDIYIDSNGTAHVTEIWDATLNEGTEGYRFYNNLGNSEINDFKVKDETREYQDIGIWNINASFKEKSYKSGINDKGDYKELCFGISQYGTHKYTLTYTISNFVSELEDAQMAYWELIPTDLAKQTNNVYIKIYADEKFEDTLDVWGYGNYGGYAYVYNGYIEMSNKKLKNNEYMTILVKFKKGTFNTTNVLDNNFDYYYKMAEKGAEHYVQKTSVWEKIGTIFSVFFSIISTFGVFIVIFIVSLTETQKYGNMSGSKQLDFSKCGKTIPKDVPMFRDIPCNKDIYRAYWVAYNFHLMKKQTDFLGVILLKWLTQDKIKIESKEAGTIFKKEDTIIVFKEKDITLDIELETRLYNYMYEASKDGILESKEFEKWCKNNYSKLLKWFDDVLDYENNRLIEEKKLEAQEKVTAKIFKRTVYVVDPSMMEEAKQMKGLKNFFQEFENMEDKEAIEVQFWKEYLMYAQIFGEAKKVAKQFKKLYPDVITEYSYDSIIFLNDISYSGVRSAESARSRAESYSSGGGGFSSGGGGGGSFGGGGGGGFR